MAKYTVDVSLKSLLSAGCHFGHTTARYNPKVDPFVYTIKNKVVIFDLAKTKEKLLEALDFLYKTAAEGGEIVFVGTKRQAADIIKEEAVKAGVHYVNMRWWGGTLTNWNQISQRIKYLKEMEEKLESGDLDHYTKLERVRLDRKLKRLRRFLEGLFGFSGRPAALVVIDIKKEAAAVREARRLGVPVVAMVDSNVDPDWVDYPIPANDDAVASIKLIMEKIGEAVLAGRQEYEKKQKKAVEKEAKKAKKEKKEKTKKVSKAKGGSK
ncbi:MAG: 30S ribosomal protein S2 [bacterium]|nr:30S ribosomal protein S2 [bacterium]